MVEFNTVNSTNNPAHSSACRVEFIPDAPPARVDFHSYSQAAGIFAEAVAGPRQKTRCGFVCVVGVALLAFGAVMGAIYAADMPRGGVMVGMFGGNATLGNHDGSPASAPVPAPAPAPTPAPGPHGKPGVCADYCAEEYGGDQNSPGGWTVANGPCEEARGLGMLEAYERAVAFAQEYYAFTVWKDLNWEEIRLSGLDSARQADSQQDPKLMQLAVRQLVPARAAISLLMLIQGNQGGVRGW